LALVSHIVKCIKSDKKLLKINLGFNWGDLGLVRMGIRTSPLFHSLLFSLILKINLGFNWGDLGLVRMGIRTSPLSHLRRTQYDKFGF
jgi:uncharacterized membrane protein YuzA (DUF378 family)